MIFFLNSGFPSFHKNRKKPRLFDEVAYIVFEIKQQQIIIIINRKLLKFTYIFQNVKNEKYQFVFLFF